MDTLDGLLSRRFLSCSILLDQLEKLAVSSSNKEALSRNSGSDQQPRLDLHVAESLLKHLQVRTLVVVRIHASTYAHSPRSHVSPSAS